MVRQATGLEYLELVTGLLQRARQSDSAGGIYEAADFQWWWRRDQHRDPAGQTFWFEQGTAIAALVFTQWGKHLGCDFLLGSADRTVAEVVWARALELLAVYRDEAVEITARDDDVDLLERLRESGFAPSGDGYVETGMLAKDRPALTPLPNGFELVSRRDAPSRPHPMIHRNGERIGERLGECSLYRAELDLAIYAPNGEVAGYALYWADPVTQVGLVEPMRVEDRYQRMGLGRCLLRAGMDRLAAAGCSTLKVTYVDGNQAAKKLYLGAGFMPQSSSRGYRRTN